MPTETTKIEGKTRRNADPEARMPFLDHLGELRRRLMYCFLVILAGFVLCFSYAEQIFEVMMLPLMKSLPEGQQLIFTSLPEPFFTYLKVGLAGGVALGLPVIFYQIWRFVAPGLYPQERRHVFPLVIWSTILFVVGASFGYFIVFPLAFGFFVGFGSASIKAMPAVAPYFSLFLRLMFGFGLIFELPVVMVFLARVGLVEADFLRKQRKFAILIVFVVSAMLTPPDVISQMLMAGPLLILYEISIVLVRIVRKNKAQAAEEEAEV